MLVILAAVTINAAFNSGIIDTAVNGAVNYADAQKKEQITFDDLDKNIQDIVNRIESYNIGGTDGSKKISISNPTIERVAETTSELTITATSKSESESNLTYKLLRGTTEDNITEIELEPEKIEGNTVTFKDTGLEMAQTYYYKVKVSNGAYNATSTNYVSERTYCLGSSCSGTRTETQTCTLCDGTRITNGSL